MKVTYKIHLKKSEVKNKLIDDLAVTLDAAGCICKGKLAKAKEVISNAISDWFSGITDYIKMYIQLPQTS